MGLQPVPSRAGSRGDRHSRRRGERGAQHSSGDDGRCGLVCAILHGLSRMPVGSSQSLPDGAGDDHWPVRWLRQQGARALGMGDRPARGARSGYVRAALLRRYYRVQPDRSQRHHRHRSRRRRRHRRSRPFGAAFPPRGVARSPPFRPAPTRKRKPARWAPTSSSTRARKARLLGLPGLST